ncbi:hypothetical protein [Microvirga sp. VF16]|uniref:hypothetical protein n=1 Tax=Microvirga sp. VF16 TaxID=2807101 RepID=UPI00193E714C|nr:hypothetical protein [Microvirga sp. VF16]QRM32622.1 hypothetical protein JO965_31560 [Microvirga sp. VF16]
MPKEAGDYHGSALQATEFAADQTLVMRDWSGQRVLHGSLDERIALLFQIELGRIGQQASPRTVQQVSRDEDGDLRSITCCLLA